MGPRPTVRMIPAVGERVNRLFRVLPTELLAGAVGPGVDPAREVNRGRTRLTSFAQATARAVTLRSTASSTRSS